MNPYMIALKFLAKWWKEIFIVLAIIGAVLYVRNLQSTVEEQRTTIAQMQAANQILKDSNKTLTATVIANNKTIDELHKGADQTKAAFDKLHASVEHQTQILNKRLHDIMSRPAPVTCDDTIKYMIDAVPSYKQ